MKTLYKIIRRRYTENDFRSSCAYKDILSLTRHLLASSLSDETKVMLLYQFNNDLITIYALSDKILANTFEI